MWTSNWPSFHFARFLNSAKITYAFPTRESIIFFLWDIIHESSQCAVFPVHLDVFYLLRIYFQALPWGCVVAAFVVLQSHGCVLRPTLVPRVWKTLPRKANLGVPGLSPEPSYQGPLNKCCCKEGACQLQRKLRPVVKVWGSICEKWKVFQISFCLAVLLLCLDFKSSAF